MKVQVIFLISNFYKIQNKFINLPDAIFLIHISKRWYCRQVLPTNLPVHMLFKLLKLDSESTDNLFLKNSVLSFKER